MDIESYTDKIQHFLKIGNYHAALNIALSGLNDCRRNDNQVCVDKFVCIIKGIWRTIAHEFGSQENAGQEKEEAISCFLCGVAEENARLLIGANGAICCKCAELSYKYFTDNNGG